MWGGLRRRAAEPGGRPAVFDRRSPRLTAARRLAGLPPCAQTACARRSARSRSTRGSWSSSCAARRWRSSTRAPRLWPWCGATCKEGGGGGQLHTWVKAVGKLLPCQPLLELSAMIAGRPAPATHTHIHTPGWVSTSGPIVSTVTGDPARAPHPRTPHTPHRTPPHTSPLLSVCCRQLLHHRLGLQQAAQRGQRRAQRAWRHAPQGHLLDPQPSDRPRGARVEPIHAQGAPPLPANIAAVAG